MTDPQTIVELDDRRRVSFGRIGQPEHRRYLVREETDGTIVMTPAVVMTETEFKLLSNPELAAQVTRALTDPSSRTRRGRPKRKD